jgi:hypothetical protein
MGTGNYLPGARWKGLEADHSQRYSSAEVKNDGAVISLLP